MRAVIVSPGGMGCTFVLCSIAACGLETNARKDEDGLKHHFDPDDSRFARFAADRVVYVWNDPLLAIMSMWRRGWLMHQRRKLTGAIPAEPESLHALWTETLTAGRDVFGIDDHYRRWRARCRQPMLALDLRRVDTQRPDLERFLELPPGTLDQVRVDRRSTYDVAMVPFAVRRIYEELDRVATGELISLSIWPRGGSPVGA